MLNPTLFPFHPISGSRMTATVDVIPGLADCEITKVGGEVLFEEGSETEVCWNASESQTLHGAKYLTNDDGDQCLVHEALWLEENVDSVEIVTAGIATSALMPNALREKLNELGSAAREVVLNAEAGQKNGDALAQLKHLLESLGLMEPVDEE